MRAAFVLLAPMALTACASLPTGQREAALGDIEARLGADALWPGSAAEENARRTQVADALKEPLTPETAVRVALANHPRTRAILEGLGVAQADYLQTMLPGPLSVGALRLKPQEGGAPDLAYSAGLDLLGLLTLRVRAGAASAERDAARAGAVGDVLVLAGAARMAMIDYIGARQAEGLLAQAAEVADAAADGADALLEAGNIAQVDRDRERLFAEEMQLRADAAKAATLATRERVTAALGLNAEQAAAWDSAPRLPAPPGEALSLVDVDARVVASSLDIAGATGALAAAKSRNSLSWVTSLLPGLSLEGERERDDGEWKSGLGLHVLAPIFDLGGAERLRLASLARQRKALAEALDVELRAEARARAVLAEAARAQALRRREVMLPLADAVFDGAVLDYNAMQISLIQLLDARRQRIETGLAAVQSVRDYWRAQAELDLLLAGGPMGSSSAMDTDPRRTPGRADPGH